MGMGLSTGPLASALTLAEDLHSSFTERLFTLLADELSLAVDAVVLDCDDSSAALAVTIADMLEQSQHLQSAQEKVRISLASVLTLVRDKVTKVAAGSTE